VYNDREYTNDRWITSEFVKPYCDVRHRRKPRLLLIRPVRIRSRALRQDSLQSWTRTGTHRSIHREVYTIMRRVRHSLKIRKTPQNTHNQSVVRLTPDELIQIRLFPPERRSADVTLARSQVSEVVVNICGIFLISGGSDCVSRAISIAD
jgi:hypothetical protein